jgi:hypothetical protein
MPPPISRDPKIAKRVQPLGIESIYRSLHIGAKALTAPRIVIRPSTSVISILVRANIRVPTRTPIAAPPIIVVIFIKVPRPTNIYLGYGLAR